MRPDEAVAGLLAGDFSRLEPDLPQILDWIERGEITDPRAIAEGLSCAAFNGQMEVLDALLRRGVDPSAGNATGLDALHWAANRGQLEAVRLLLRFHANPETRSMYDTTALRTAIWSAFHEPRPAHLQIIEALVKGGARTDVVGYPTGNEKIDAILQR